MNVGFCFEKNGFRAAWLHGTKAAPVLVDREKCVNPAPASIVNSAIANFKGTYVLVDMEYLPEGSIADRILKHGITFTEALRAARHVLLGLAASHREGVIHRDVKPANILISGTDYKLSDFGISQLKATAFGQPMFYSPNAAPEVINVHPSDEKSDIYSLGVTLFRLCALRGDTSIPMAEFGDWLSSGMKKGLPAFLGYPAYIPPRLRRVIQKATEAAPKDRYQTAEEMLAAIEKLKISLGWSKIDNHHWLASERGKQHCISIVQKPNGWHLSYTLNGRRRVADCAVFGTEGLATGAMQKKIASSVLA